MGIRRALSVACLLFAAFAHAQQRGSADDDTASITGVVVDPQDALIPNATVQVVGGSVQDRSVKTNEVGAFYVNSLPPGTALHVTVKASGFGDWKSDAITLTPGQTLELDNVKLIVAAEITSVSAATPEKVAIQQVEFAERQRLFGILPNFYVTYDSRFVPLSPKLKFRLAYRTATDAATFLGSGVLAGINMAADIAPHYQQGALGYAKRYGAVYTSTAADLIFGSAIYPVLFRQDPRYFYKGTGTKKARLVHAISAPFVAKGDNGNWQPNISSISGDLTASALQNLYYPKADRGVSLVFKSALQITGIRVVNGLMQEFVYRRLTTNSGRQIHHQK